MPDTPDQPLPVPESSNKQSNLLEDIKKRPPELLKENFERNIQAIEKSYLAEQIKDQKSRDLIETLAGKPLDTLHKRAGDFLAFYEAALFNNITHAAQEDLGDNVTLKSPERLITEGVIDKAAASGALDREMGNTNYVFASLSLLPSRSSNGERRYKISSTDGYAVPVDHADMIVPENDIEVYRNNLYTIDDFKVFFSTYAASLFEKPEDFLAFINAYNPKIWPVSFWERGLKPVHEAERTSESENDAKIFEKMKQLLMKDSIYPPFSPEFQFKDEVEATGEPYTPPTPEPKTTNHWDDSEQLMGK